MSWVEIFQMSLSSVVVSCRLQLTHTHQRRFSLLLILQDVWSCRGELRSEVRRRRISKLWWRVGWEDWVGEGCFYSTLDSVSGPV